MKKRPLMLDIAIGNVIAGAIILVLTQDPERALTHTLTCFLAMGLGVHLARRHK